MRRFTKSRSEFSEFNLARPGQICAHRRNSETEPATKMASNSNPRAKVVAGRMILTLPTKGDRCRHEFGFTFGDDNLIANVKGKFAGRRSSIKADRIHSQ